VVNTYFSEIFGVLLLRLYLWFLSVWLAVGLTNSKKRVGMGVENNRVSRIATGQTVSGKN